MPKLETAVKLSATECNEAILAEWRNRPPAASVILGASGASVRHEYPKQDMLRILTEHAKRAAGIKGQCSSTCDLLEDPDEGFQGADIRFANIKPS